MPTGDPRNLELDPGALWVAPVNTTPPAGNATAFPSPIAGFRSLGYTLAGSKFVFTPTFADIDVEEEIDPVRIALTKRKAAIEVDLVEMTRSNLALALNIAANAVNDATKLSAPSPGADLAVFLMWESTVCGARWLFYQCKQAGAVSIERRKPPNRSGLPTKFEMEKPVGLPIFDVWPSNVGALGVTGVLV